MKSRTQAAATFAWCLLLIISCTTSSNELTSDPTQEKRPDTGLSPRSSTASTMAGIPQPMLSREIWEGRIDGLDRMGSMDLIASELLERWPPPPHFTGIYDGVRCEYPEPREVRRGFNLDNDWALVASFRCDERHELPPGAAGVLKTWTIVGLGDFRADMDDECFEAVRAIHHVSNENYPDPVSLLRAANRLRAMGKRRAIDAMRTYLRLCDAHPQCDVYGFDDERVKELADLVFKRRGTDGPLPMTRVPWMWLPQRGSVAWPSFPFSVSHGLPFRVPTAGVPFSKGPLGTAGWLLDFCAVSAELRTEVLVPETNPIDAAEEFLIAGKWDEIECAFAMGEDPSPSGHDLRRTWPDKVREQAARALSNVVTYTELEPPRPFPLPNRAAEIPFAQRWERYRAMVEERRPRWNPGIGEFVPTMPVIPGKSEGSS